MDGITVSGRGFSDPSVQITAHADRVCIRVDDGRRAESWFEVALSADVLGELLSRIIAHRPAAQPALLALLASIGNGSATD